MSRTSTVTNSDIRVLRSELEVAKAHKEVEAAMKNNHDHDYLAPFRANMRLAEANYRTAVTMQAVIRRYPPLF